MRKLKPNKEEDEKVVHSQYRFGALLDFC